MLEQYPFQHLVPKRELKADLAPEMSHLEERGSAFCPGFAGSSSIPQHLIDLVVENLMPGPKAIEDGSGLELAPANLLCQTAQGKANLP